jgi:hypothetical protein
VSVALAMLSVAFAVLVSVVVWGELVWNLTTWPKARLAGTIFTKPIVSMIVALANLVASVTEVATSITVEFADTVVGAV